MTREGPEADLLAMWRIRAFEEKLRELHKAGDLLGSVHLCIGQEAGPVGACAALTEQDALFATYRGHGWAIARGVPLRPLFAELLGRATGVNGGRGGSAYFSAADHGFHGENSIVGGGVSHAVGAALAGRHDGSGRIAMTVFGDGAMNQGAVAEAMNFAAAFDLPVLFLCENNRYSELTPIRDMVRNEALTDRATALGIAATRIDGNDPALVRSTVARYADAARDGRGPAFVELITQRLVGHYIGDVQQYRTRAELEEDGRAEPIARATAALAESGVDTEAIERAARDEVDAAAATALADPPADPATAKEHLYA
ncbi:thiamine pyrophosphate-dependent dehydrogenase E1 component subunit alpha [Prauserella endophytica]|uniref:Thiamine pyrophosphate-dependent dehydrogenase E1 component subunit alpha n=1 Tax=Prauserella endophytica TaxID=1592324 RepID=A0ABY2SAQ3_9PSEU|nr:thiamine pyrophosphate-dependent dehydrogenase E1 component subunit alpha [Prauserella endophytica]PXY29083.1 acetoin dehydrogenase [Prauserella coralliicola]TKG72771.1 thiamine pyrophosphate-dependent dehydrogenase E1 component subunit alpha [Prauserella endophytica]